MEPFVFFLHTNVCLLIHVWIYMHGLPKWLSNKESTCQAGDTSLIPGLGGSPGEGNGNPPQYFCLGNPMDGGAWWAIVHGVPELNTTEQLTLTPMERGLATPESASLSHVVLLEMTLLSYTQVLFICLVGYTEIRRKNLKTSLC